MFRVKGAPTGMKKIYKLVSIPNVWDGICVSLKQMQLVVAIYFLLTTFFPQIMAHVYKDIYSFPRAKRWAQDIMFAKQMLFHWAKSPLCWTQMCTRHLIRSSFVSTDERWGSFLYDICPPRDFSHLLPQETSLFLVDFNFKVSTYTKYFLTN